MTKFQTAYVKSRDGRCWYVSDRPLNMADSPGYQLGGHIYAATTWSAEENKRRAIRYARFVGHQIVVQNGAA